MIINHNISALNTNRQMGINNAAGSKAMEKLSSGLRINRAGDDAAGLAISEKMRGQIKGLNQASRNSQDGISLIQTAEGALQETHNILQRMRELAVQSANDTNNDVDRGEIQKEIDQLKSEIDRIANTTEFNTKKLLNGDVGQKVDTTSNLGKVGEVRATDGSLDGTYTAEFSNITKTIESVKSAGGVSKADIGVELDPKAAENALKAGKYTVEFSGAADDATAVLKDENGKVLATAKSDGADPFEFSIDGTNTALTIADGKYNGTGGTLEFEVQLQADVKISNADGTEQTYKDVKADSSSVISAGGFDFDVTTNLAAAATEVNVTNNGVKFHIGANQGQNTLLAINKMDTASLKVGDIDLKTQTGADDAITVINNAIEKVSSERSKLGANQNRLEHTISNLNNSAENLQAAESRIRDVDMAKEVMEMTRANILGQASQAMLAQANQKPQSVLQLLS